MCTSSLDVPEANDQTFLMELWFAKQLNKFESSDLEIRDTGLTKFFLLLQQMPLLIGIAYYFAYLQ